MIKSATIQNFQSHKKTELLFHKGVNVIIGNSDSGKSAIFRAMNWVINNRPSGGSFRSNWGGDTKVVLEADQTVIRIRTNSRNVYCLGDEFLEFKSIKTDVPKEVSSVLNMSPINIQKQLDSHFLINNSSGEVSKFLNKIVNLDKIDQSIAKAESEKRRCNNLITDKKDSIEYGLDHIKKFNNITEIEHQLTVLEKVSKEITEAEIQIANIKTIVDRLITLEYRENKYSNLSQIVNTYQGLEIQHNKLLEESKLRGEVFQEVSNINALKKWKIKFKNLSTIEENYNQIQIENLGLIKNMEEKETLYSLTQIISSYNTTKVQLQNKLNDFEEKYNNLMPEVCPLCNQKIIK